MCFSMDEKSGLNSWVHRKPKEDNNCFSPTYHIIIIIVFVVSTMFNNNEWKKKKMRKALANILV